MSVANVALDTTDDEIEAPRNYVLANTIEPRESEQYPSMIVQGSAATMLRIRGKLLDAPTVASAQCRFSGSAAGPATMRPNRKCSK